MVSARLGADAWVCSTQKVTLSVPFGAADVLAPARGGAQYLLAEP